MLEGGTYIHAINYEHKLVQFIIVQINMRVLDSLKYQILSLITCEQVSTVIHMLNSMPCSILSYYDLWFRYKNVWHSTFSSVSGSKDVNRL